MEFVVVDKNGGEKNVWLLVAGDGNVERYGRRGGVDDSLGLDRASFGGNEEIGFGDAGQDEDVRGVADSVGFFVGNHADFAVLAAPPIIACAGDPEKAAGLHFALFGSLRFDAKEEAACLFR